MIAATLERRDLAPRIGTAIDASRVTLLGGALAKEIRATLEECELRSSGTSTRLLRTCREQRQIAIMRTAWVTKATYMWSSHLNMRMWCQP